MALTIIRKTGGGKLSRTEIVTIRTDPRLRYLAEIAARSDRRTLSAFIERAVEDSLLNAILPVAALDASKGTQESVAGAADDLWDVDEADRFAKLAFRYPTLLTFDEEVLWKLIRENGYFWRATRKRSDNEWTWDVNEASIRLPELREHWETLKDVAAGDAAPSTLPSREQ